METKELLKIAVDDIIESGWDYEKAHSEEDKLHLTLIHLYCPDWVKEEVRRLSEADFARYCA